MRCTGRLPQSALLTVMKQTLFVSSEAARRGQEATSDYQSQDGNHQQANIADFANLPREESYSHFPHPRLAGPRRLERTAINLNNAAMLLGSLGRKRKARLDRRSGSAYDSRGNILADGGTML